MTAGDVLDMAIELGVVLGALLLLAFGALHCLREERPAHWILFMAVLPYLGPVVYIVWLSMQPRKISAEERALAPSMTRREADRAIVSLEQRRRDGIHIPAETRDLGQAYFAAGRYEAAADLLGEYVAESEAELRAKYFRAQALLKLERWREAIEALQDVIAQDENFDAGYGLILLARAFAGHGDPERAALCYEKALEHSRIPEAMYQLALLRLEEGREEEGRQLLDRTIDAARTAETFERRHARHWARLARARKAELAAGESAGSEVGGA